MTSEILSPLLLLALLAGLGVGGGIALFTAAVVGWPRKQRQAGPSLGKQAFGFLQRRAAAAVIVALVVLVVLRWPMAAIAAGLLVLFWGKLFGGAKAERASKEKMAALAAWTESLRDTIAGAAGLEQAIGASARTAGEALRPHMIALDDRVRTRMPLTDALTMLSDEINDGRADKVIAALKQSADLRGEGLKLVLGNLAVSAREQVAMRQRIFAGRAGTRRSVQIVVGVIVAVVVGMRVFNPAYTEPYNTVQGQGVLALVLAVFAGGLIWLQRLSRVPDEARFLVPAQTGESR